MHAYSLRYAWTFLSIVGCRELLFEMKNIKAKWLLFVLCACKGTVHDLNMDTSETNTHKLCVFYTN